MGASSDGPGVIDVEERGQPDVAVAYMGGQLNHKTTKLFEEIGYDGAELVSPEDIDPEEGYAAVVYPGGPHSAWDEEVPDIPWKEFNCPVLAICLSHQVAAHSEGAEVTDEEDGEFGMNQYVEVDEVGGLFPEEIFEEGERYQILMSHGDTVLEIPEGWRQNCTSWSGKIAGMENVEEDIYTVQFHPEASQTVIGPVIVSRILELSQQVEEDEFQGPEKLLEGERA